VARTWLQVRVDLLARLGVRLTPSAGRIFIVGPAHTFSALADAINAAFARWDLSHLHEFELAGGRRIGFADPDPFEDDGVVEDQAAVKVAAAVVPGDEFRFVFDFGDRWEHRCRVLDEKADPRQEWGEGRLPRQPVAIWGWGLVPDQYGRESAAELDLEP
jgi:Plasmid pRiA4b ORF-3-like protein